MRKKLTRTADSWCDKLKSLAKGKVIFNEPLSKHTTFRIGGFAEVWFEPRDKNDLINVLKHYQHSKSKFFVIGAGSNLLVEDKGFKGLVINLGSDIFNRVKLKGNTVYAGAGVSISNLNRFCLGKSFSGFEFFVGMPGTVGGAIAMNIGTHSPDDFSEWHSISDCLESVEILDKDNKFHKISSSKLKFSYKKSSLKGSIILAATFRLRKMSRKLIKAQIHKYLDYRKKTQDYSHPSAGCIFKNPPGVSAGFMIDASGLKGKKIGDAMISNKHANFIVNLKDADAKSVLRLMGIARQKVKEMFGIDLEPEIEILGKK